MNRFVVSLVAMAILCFVDYRGGAALAGPPPNQGRQVNRVAMASTVTILTDNRALASGFIWRDSKGGGKWLVTNEHAVRGASQIAVVHWAARSQVSVSSAIVVDAARDLAILPVPLALQQLPGLEIAEASPEPGDDVFALGAPKGLDSSFTKGVVSAFRTNPSGRREIQTDVAVTHGSSGGPLLNGDGRLIGIIRGGYDKTPGMNFAICAPELIAAIQGRSMPQAIRRNPAPSQRPPERLAIVESQGPGWTHAESTDGRLSITVRDPGYAGKESPANWWCYESEDKRYSVIAPPGWRIVWEDKISFMLANPANKKEFVKVYVQPRDGKDFRADILDKYEIQRMTTDFKYLTSQTRSAQVQRYYWRFNEFAIVDDVWDAGSTIVIRSVVTEYARDQCRLQDLLPILDRISYASP